MPDTKPRSAVIYCRISEDRVGAGVGAGQQEADCRALAEQLGWEVVDLYVDNDISAYSGKTRPAYRAMLERLNAGGVGSVLAWHTDRLHRSPSELEEYIDVCERGGVTTQTVQAGEIDLGTPSGRAVARTLGAWARFESEHKSERVRASMRRRTAEGRFGGGTRPFGWDKHGMTVLPEEAEVIREASRRLLAGESVTSLAKELRARDVRGPRGGVIENSTLRGFLLRPRNAGLIVSHGEIIGRGQWQPIVAEDTFYAVRDLLTAPGRRTNAGAPRVRWFGSMLYRCGRCGAPMITSKRPEGNGRITGRVYVCRAERHLLIGQPETDEYVQGVIAALLRRPETLSRFTVTSDGGPDLSALREQLAASRARMDQVPVDYASGLLTGSQAAHATELIGQQIVDLERQLSRHGDGQGMADLVSAPDPGAWFLAAPVGTQRAVLSMIAEVSIKPASRGRPKGWVKGEPYHDSDRVVITPKGAR